MAKKDAEEQKKGELIAKCGNWWTAAENSRKNNDWTWFLYDLWVWGYHYAKYDMNTQQIITIAPKDGVPKVTINKIYITLRAVRNFVLRNRPRAEVTPENMTEADIPEATKINRFLDYLYDKLSLSLKLKESMWHALKYSIGWWQVLWDEDKEEIAVNVIDPYDLYWDPLARTVDEARYVILAVTRSLEYCKENKQYDQDQVKLLQGERITAASSLKQRLNQLQRGDVISNSDNKAVLIKEYWMWTEDKKIRLVTIADNLILRDEVTDLTRLPFFRLASDIEPLSMTGQGWVKNMISPNRLLNRLESQIAEFNEIMNKGKWVTDKGAGVRVINNQQGQIIEKKRGYNVTQANIVPLSSIILNQIENCNRYIEDIGGAHDASMGRIPTGAKSGKALEALQVGDSNNMSEVIENTEYFLEDVYEYILELCSQKYQYARNIVPLNSAGQREFMSVIGAGAEQKVPNATVIPKKTYVDVRITSWLAQTAEARREALKELFSMQAIDVQTLLEGYAIGNIADVVARVKVAQKEAQKMQQENNAAQIQTAGAVDMAKNEQKANLEARNTAIAPKPAAPAEEGFGVQEAISAIRMLIQGQNPTIPEKAKQEYLDYIDSFLQTPEAKKLPPKMQQVIQQFREEVMQNSL